MSARRVCVIWYNPLFLDSLRVLLRHPEIEWVGVLNAQAGEPTETIAEKVKQLRPDIILMEWEEEGKGKKAAEILELIPGNLKIISLTLQNNTVRLYVAAEETLTQMDELIQWITTIS